MGPLEGSHLRTRPTSPPAHILRLSKAMTQGKDSNGAYVMELVVSLSGAWVKMRFSDVHPEITRDVGVTRHSLPVVTSEREDSSSPTPHTVSQDTNKSYAEFLKQMVEGDDGEDGGKDDPRPEAYADDSPVQTGWELAQGVECQRTKDGKGPIRAPCIKFGSFPYILTSYVFLMAFLSTYPFARGCACSRGPPSRRSAMQKNARGSLSSL